MRQYAQREKHHPCSGLVDSAGEPNVIRVHLVSDGIWYTRLTAREDFPSRGACVKWDDLVGGWWSSSLEGLSIAHCDRSPATPALPAAAEPIGRHLCLRFMYVFHLSIMLGRRDG